MSYQWIFKCFITMWVKGWYIIYL